MATNARGRGIDRTRIEGAPLLERVLAGLGGLMLAAGVAFLVHDGLTNDQGPGAVVATVTKVTQVGDAYVVEVVLENEGGETLSDLQLGAHVMDDKSELESVAVAIDYLPGHSTRKAGLYLRHDPRRYRLEIRAEGYQAL